MEILLTAAVRELQASQQMAMPDVKATRANQEEMKATVSAIQEKMEAKVDTAIRAYEVMINTIQSKLEETIKNQVESVLALLTNGPRASAQNAMKKLKKHRWAYR
jgi:uncharacterized alkaline shock family protein YloU